ncbi:SACS [Mytilus edulis]|uniref:SACS n=1 Tax=Mytilus edulis TaxID=6550 RepID=A0A8S3V4P2_MYTED|nr:SACS [Mytilus edulis]
MHFTHDSISNEIAMALGINTKRKHKVEECSKDLYSQDFGQHEELLTRIKRILDGYPFDVCILKELLQNADDAKASEVHIVVDFNNHPTDDLFGEMWKPLQGPALLVFNDSYFTEADITGIQNLGVGSKETIRRRLGSMVLVLTQFTTSLTYHHSYLEDNMSRLEKSFVYSTLIVIMFQRLQAEILGESM